MGGRGKWCEGFVIQEQGWVGRSLGGSPVSMPNWTRRSTSSAQMASGGSRYSKGKTPRHRWAWRAAWAERVTAMTAARGRYRDRSWAELKEAERPCLEQGKSPDPGDQSWVLAPGVTGKPWDPSWVSRPISLGLGLTDKVGTRKPTTRGR